MRLEEILNHNRAFVAGRPATPLPAAVNLPLAVVACYDPRLDTLLHDALGLHPTEAFLFRAAGALLRPDSNSLRSLANSVFFFGVSEVMVVGHTSCRMAAFSAPEYISAFRARGVAREAFGNGDLREWAGAIPSPRAGVLRSLEALATAPYLPRELRIAGAVLDDTTGELELVSPATSLAERSVTLPSVAAQEPAAAREVAPPDAPEPAKDSHEVEALREFVHLLESAAGWKEELTRARAEIHDERNPLAKLKLVEAFLRRATVNSKEVAQAFERLKRDEQLVALFLGAARRKSR